MSARPDPAQAAFEELAARHRARLVAFAASIAPPGAADDVVQDALLRAHLALARGDRPECPKAWLYAIVRNTALNHRRSWRPHEQLDETIDGVEQPPDAAERRLRFGRLVEGLRGLPAGQRAAIVKRELEGRGHDEIAGSLGVSPAAVRQLIFRARTSLRAGVGALVPTGLLRLIALPGASEAGAGAGLGPAVAKLGVGAAIATGAVVGGVGVDSVDRDAGVKGAAGQVALAPEDASAASPASKSPPARDGAEPGEEPARGGDRGGPSGAANPERVRTPPARTPPSGPRGERPGNAPHRHGEPRPHAGGEDGAPAPRRLDGGEEPAAPPTGGGGGEDGRDLRAAAVSQG